MAEFNSHKWTRKFKEAQADNAKLMEDYSTMKLKSNIDQKWVDDRDMISDLRQWFEASAQSGGYDLADDIVSALEVEARYAREYLKKNSSSIRRSGPEPDGVDHDEWTKNMMKGM
tara:strand:- start:71 stop:415 length:345 start_codon:yes stop_codon:yes gene_type:complete